MIIEKKIYKSKILFLSFISELFWLFFRMIKGRSYRVQQHSSLFTRKKIIHNIIKLNVNDNGDIKCNSCMICVEACPQSCITIKNEKETLSRPKLFEIDFSRCIFCNECISICSINALTTGEANLVQIAGDRSLVLGIKELKNA